MPTQKQVSYQTINTYETKNEHTKNTKNVWIVFHGLGYLSRYFLRYFENLNPEENYIIAPQAPSKYYLGSKYKHVGACWLTKENTQLEKENVLNYIDKVAEAEMISTAKNLIVLGYSQGVSIATRWLASRNIQCNHLILHSGAIPTELNKGDFSYLYKVTPVTYIYGNNDEYITEAKMTEQSLKGSSLFGERLEVKVFKGVHEVFKPYLLEVSMKNPTKLM